LFALRYIGFFANAMRPTKEVLRSLKTQSSIQERPTSVMNGAMMLYSYCYGKKTCGMEYALLF
jgi:hypothetical protein